MIAGHYRPIGEGTLTVGTDSVGIVQAVGIVTADISRADAALISVHTNPIFYRMTAEAATGDTDSHHKAVDSEFVLVGQYQIGNFRAIQDGGGAVLHITLFRA